MLAHPQHQQARGCEWRHSDKRHRDTDENRQKTDPVGDGANCFHELPLSTVILRPPPRVCKHAPASREIQACANGCRLEGRNCPRSATGREAQQQAEMQKRCLQATASCQESRRPHAVRTAASGSALWQATGNQIKTQSLNWGMAPIGSAHEPS